jgi:lysophospholipase L1-like esterase
MTGTSGIDGGQGDPAPFLKGSLYPARPEAAYPRAESEVPVSRLPRDTWASACIPVGVRLAFEGDARAVEVDYRCHEPSPDNAGILGLTRQLRPTLLPQFELWDRDRLLGTAPAGLAGGLVRLDLSGPGPWTLYLPELLLPIIDSVRGIGGTLAPRPSRPRWLAYGDSLTEGWCASSPALNWPARVGRRLDLEMVNLGYSGAARGELAVAEMLARQPADLITVAFGTNCWTRVAHSAGLFVEVVATFLDILRSAHPTIPIVCLSPVVRPDGETTPNARGLTHGELRRLFEMTVRERRDGGDANLHLIEGLPLVPPDELADGVHPNDTGHGRMADAVADLLARLI